ERRNERADVCAGVKDSGSQCPLFLRKPFGDRFDRRRKVSCLAKTEKEARDAKAKHAARERVAHRRYAPEDYCQRESLARADAIHQSTDTEQADRVRSLE